MHRLPLSALFSTFKVSILGVSILGVLLLAGAAMADGPDLEKKKITVTKEKVYLGSTSNFKKPGVVQLGRIFKETEPYKQIIREKLDRGDPKYRILLVEANKVAKKAMKRVHDEEGYDLVVEKGHLEIEGEEVPEITDVVIAALE